MSLILSGQVIGSVRCHVVRGTLGLFLLIPTCISLSKLITTHALTCVFCVYVFRCERLEEQLNDLTELHQNEILNLKQELASMEEKIAYQSYERARDIQVCLSGCCPQALRPCQKQLLKSIELRIGSILGMKFPYSPIILKIGCFSLWVFGAN